jgi:hypothetical protein
MGQAFNAFAAGTIGYCREIALPQVNGLLVVTAVAVEKLPRRDRTENSSL